MKTKITLLCLLIAMNFASKAQNSVTIPDANFVIWLTAHIPSAMNGNLMDTSSTAVTTLTSIELTGLNITNLSGIQYFDSLIFLECSDNQLTSLPSLPSKLNELKCLNNQLTSIPALPSGLTQLWCGHNQLTSLPVLPSGLFFLLCGFNQLTSLPTLPSELWQLLCGANSLTNLPALPDELNNLECYSNQLTSLPVLPSGMTYLNCGNNNISCFPTFPNTLIYTNYFSISGNPFTCLPNYVPAMNSSTLAYPLCTNGDTINNYSGCPSANGIAGFTYKDSNTSCIKDTGDLSLANIPIKLYDNINNLLVQTYSLSNGIYNFPVSEGTYTVKIDSADFPFTVLCDPGFDSTLTLTNIDSLATDVNFAITCKPGFDVGVQSVFTNGWVFPGQPHSLSIIAGDINQWYNLNCANGISGQVQITITGPVTYTSIAVGALNPIITGNVFTYTIANFGTINNAQDFGLLFTTDTTAQAGDQICVDVTVTPTNGDNNASNNNYQFCYQVINSYDPNLKEVYPVDVLLGYQDWFTYTIHFQNTGTAPAFNIRLVDTLSNNLDMETFQVINYSHHNTISIQNKVLTVRFPNIMLPDSTSNFEGSKGFVQYRVKPKPNLPLGTQIKNTASIYFDYNAPIVTNTTTNEYTQTASIKETKTNASISIYPNPGTGKYKIKIDIGQLSIDNYQLSIYNILGEKIYQSEIQNQKSEIDISQQPNGIYIVRVNGSKQSLNQRIIKQ